MNGDITEEVQEAMVDHVSCLPRSSTQLQEGASTFTFSSPSYRIESLQNELKDPKELSNKRQKPSKEETREQR